MEYNCPVCKTGGSIPEDRLHPPVTKTMCQNCGTILLVNPATGKVDAHKSPIKDVPEFENAGTRPAQNAAPVLSMGPPESETRDWPAIAVVVICLILLIAAGVYFTVN